MSLKSQKSLYEECSEIVERSYSVKSASNESLSCSDDEDYLAVELLHKLSPPALSKLRARFRVGGKRGGDVESRVESVMRAAAASQGIEFAAPAPPPPPAARERWIDEAGLVAAVGAVLGQHKYSAHAHRLYRLLDPFGTGRATWTRLVDKMVQHGARHTRSRREEWKEIKVTRIKKLPHCKRETIVKLVPIQHAGSYCVVAVTRGGRAGVYSGDLALLATYQVFHHRGGNTGRVKNCWITDAVYMSDVQLMVYASSERSLLLYTARTPTHTARLVLRRLPALPTCLAYTASLTTGSCELAVGSERGDVYRLRCLRPRVATLYAHTTETTRDVVWKDLRTLPHSSYTHVYSERGVHARAVRRLLYVKDGDYLLSCSNDDSASVCVRPLPAAAPASSYVYRAPRGASSFHYVPSLPVLAVTSLERVLVWRGPPEARPATLRARARLRDVAVSGDLRVVIALAVDCTLYIWDLDEEVLLQCLKLKFPFLGVLGKKVEFGAYSIHPGPPEFPPSPSTPSSHSASRATTPPAGGDTAPQHWCCRRLQDDPEHSRFSAPSLLVSCCSHVAVLRAAHLARGRPPPPPPRAAPERAPAQWGRGWALPPTPSRPSPPSSSPPVPPTPPLPPINSVPLSAVVSRQASTEHVDTDLDSLLHKAGLEGILEKDFILMRGLKHDLNKKLTDMRENMKSKLLWARAPHLSLSLAPHLSLSLTASVAPLAADDELMTRHRRVASLFPASSVTVTPVASERTTPRERYNANHV